jgi:hypothetical protein
MSPLSALLTLVVAGPTHRLHVIFFSFARIFP